MDDALINASGKGHANVVELLLAAGADVGADDHYALQYATMNGHSKCVALLLRYGADPSKLHTSYVMTDADRDAIRRYQTWKRRKPLTFIAICALNERRKRSRTEF